METTTEPSEKAPGDGQGFWMNGLVTQKNSPVHTRSFKSKVRSGSELKSDSVLVEIKVPKGMVDMFARPYPRRMVVWVHHFDDYGVLVEGTYSAVLAKKALKKAGYGSPVVWAYRPILVNAKASTWPYGAEVGGGSAVAFYFDVQNALN